MQRFLTLFSVFLGLVATAAQADAPTRAERPLLRGAIVQDVVTEVAAERIRRPKPRSGAAKPPALMSVRDLAVEYGAGGKTAAVLIDMTTGDVMEAYNGAVDMPPASVTKIVTALYGIETLGAGFHFETEVLLTGPVIGGQVQGDIVLVGGGDPALDSDELAGLVSDLDAAGVKSASGRFLYYADTLIGLREIDDGQPIHAAYNPGVSGLNLNFNRVYLEWSKAGELSLEARAERNSPRVSGVSVRKEARNGPVYKYDVLGGADHWSIAEGALKRAGGVWLPVRDPSPYAAEVFRELARQKNITLPRGIRADSLPDGQSVARMERRELHLLSRGMLHFSTNLTAEAIGLTASNARGAYTGLGGSGQMMRDWAAQTYGVRNAVFRDHSGLGDFNRISALDMAQLVTQAGRAGKLDGLLRRYVVTDKTGKRPAMEGVDVRAKTGTLNFVRGLSGIIHGLDGRQLAFAIFSADLDARGKIDGTLSRPPGTKRFNTRAVAFERALLRRWIAAHAG